MHSCLSPDEAVWYIKILSQWNKSSDLSTSFLSWCPLLVSLAPGSASGHIWCLKTGFHNGELRTDVTFKGGKSASLPSSARNSEQTLLLLSSCVHLYYFHWFIKVKHSQDLKKKKSNDWTSKWTTFSNFHFSHMVQKIDVPFLQWQHQYLTLQRQYLTLWTDFHLNIFALPTSTEIHQFPRQFKSFFFFSYWIHVIIC